MNERKEEKRVTSIARKINLQNVGSMLLAYLWVDILVCIVLAAVMIYGLDVQLAGRFDITYARKLMIETSVRDMVYQVGHKGSSVYYLVEIGPWLIWFMIGGCVVLVWELVEIIKKLMRGTYSVRRELRPLNELAAKAQELSEMSFDESAFDESKYHDLEDAISSLKVEREDAKIQMHDKDLAGIENALNDLLERMRASYKQQVQFVSDASQLRTPIAVIQGYVNMLDRWGKDDQAILTESIEAIKNESGHMQKLVEQLLFLARGDSNRQTLDMKSCSLNDIMREVYEESVMIDEKHHYRYEEKGNGYVWADTDMLKQSARILIDNAAKYTPQGEDIVIRVGVLNDGKVTDAPFYEIQDNGIGMGQKDVEHAFDRFYRADAVRNSKTGGTGLGLAIVKKLVDLMHGDVIIQSNSGQGTKIQISLPLRIATENQLHQSDKAKEYKIGLDGMHVLLVEDNELNAEIAMEVLKNKGILVNWVPDGCACVEEIQDKEAGTYQFILMDVQMPRMNGYEATQKIRQLADVKKAQIPIIAMTANAFEEDRKHALDAGMDGFIMKPFRVDEMMKVIGEVMK